MPRNRQVERPVILGVVGDSAAGKTTLTAGIAEALGPERVTVLCTDDYHRFDRAERAERGLSPLDPLANHLDVLETHVRALRQGRPILKPVYDHATGRILAPEHVEPREYIVLEGLLGYHTRGLRDCYDVKVYLEPEESLRRAWKLQRDTARRGYTESEVMTQLQDLARDAVDYIKPQRTFADIVVRFFPPLEHEAETGAHLNVRHTLRPTLPHPDLSPVLDRDPESESGLRLELARDVDGKPVDVLEILGDLDDGRARAMEDLIWGLIPEADHLRDTLRERAGLGRFLDDGQQSAFSHPLALTQLLLTYHLVKAALGHYAV